MPAIQIDLPPSPDVPEFQQTLQQLRKMGIDGLELNITEPGKLDVQELQAILRRHDLSMTAYATGADARLNRLSLSSRQKTVRQRSIDRCKIYLDTAAALGADIIIGYLKGGSGEDPVSSSGYLTESMARVGDLARSRKVSVQLEATNRYEASTANSLEQAWDILAPLSNPYLSILPDTFHMNIEETSIAGALSRFMGKFKNLHLSDNNRLFPGLGGMDFKSLLAFLHMAGYAGRLSIEGKVRSGLLEDLRGSLRYLNGLLPEKQSLRAFGHP